MQIAAHGQYSCDHSRMRLEIISIFFLCSFVYQIKPLRCYTCDKKVVDRFTKEESVSRKCSSNQKEWSEVTCTDPREYCKYEIDDQISYRIHTRGCAIPRGKLYNILAS